MRYGRADRWTNRIWLTDVDKVNVIFVLKPSCETNRVCLDGRLSCNQVREDAVASRLHRFCPRLLFWDLGLFTPFLLFWVADAAPRVETENTVFPFSGCEVYNNLPQHFISMDACSLIGGLLTWVFHSCPGCITVWRCVGAHESVSDANSTCAVAPFMRSALKIVKAPGGQEDPQI